LSVKLLIFNNYDITVLHNIASGLGNAMIHQISHSSDAESNLIATSFTTQITEMCNQLCILHFTHICHRYSLAP